MIISFFNTNIHSHMIGQNNHFKEKSEIGEVVQKAGTRKSQEIDQDSWKHTSYKIMNIMYGTHKNSILFGEKIIEAWKILPN